MIGEPDHFSMKLDSIRLAQALDNIGLTLNSFGQLIVQIHEMLMRAGLGPAEIMPEPKEEPPASS